MSNKYTTTFIRSTLSSWLPSVSSIDTLVSKHIRCLYPTLRVHLTNRNLLLCPPTNNVETPVSYPDIFLPPNP